MSALQRPGKCLRIINKSLTLRPRVRFNIVFLHLILPYAHQDT